MYFCSIDTWSADINTDILNASNGNGGNYPEGGNPWGDQGGNPNPNPGGGPQKPQWRPFEYHPNIKEKGSYPPDNHSPASVLETYDPTGKIPPQNDKQLGVLIDYRFGQIVRPRGFYYWNVSNVFPNDNLIDNTARERLLAHIYDHRSDLPTAYKELGINNGPPQWDKVRITSYIINSLNRSNN